MSIVIQSLDIFTVRTYQDTLFAYEWGDSCTLFVGRRLNKHISVFYLMNNNCLLERRFINKFATIFLCVSIVAGAFRNISYRTYTSFLLQESAMACENARMILFYRTTVTMAPVSFDWCSLSSQQHRDTNQVSSCQEFNEGRGCSTGVGVSPDLAKKSDCKNFELVSRHDRLMPWFLCFSFLPNLLIHMFR
jgi:hypothetical protein